MSDFTEGFKATVDRFDGLPASNQVDYYRTKAKEDAATITDLRAEVERLRLFIASDASRAAGILSSLSGPVVPGDSAEAYLARMSDLMQREGAKLEAAIRAALASLQTGEKP